jgi:hypothetical protein
MIGFPGGRVKSGVSRKTSDREKSTPVILKRLPP